MKDRTCRLLTGEGGKGEPVSHMADSPLFASSRQPPNHPQSTAMDGITCGKCCNRNPISILKLNQLWSYVDSRRLHHFRISRLPERFNRLAKYLNLADQILEISIS